MEKVHGNAINKKKFNNLKMKNHPGLAIARANLPPSSLLLETVDELPSKPSHNYNAFTACWEELPFQFCSIQ